MLKTIESFREKIDQTNYVASQELLTSLWLMNQLERPLLLEGEAGVGKTEVGKMLATVYECPLIRLQCYAGLDVSNAVYEWNYQRQLLAIQRQKLRPDNTTELSEQDLFGEAYLLKRPLLQSISAEKSVVLMVDEIDRADEEFEAYLLELLSDFQISVPELGTIKARSIPQVILTSNGTRELSDALRRRCLFHYIDYPDYDKELNIVLAKIPGIGAQLASQLVNFVQQLRKQDLNKIPGVAETLDWAGALMQMEITVLNENPEAIVATMGCLLKTREDQDLMAPAMIDRMVARS